jgi:hypothetical protein
VSGWRRRCRSAEPPEAQAEAIFSPIEPLSRRYVSLTTDTAGEADSRGTHIGIWTLATKGGVVTST